MPKKRSQKSDGTNDTDVSAARGRLMGALQGIVHGSEEESEESDLEDDTADDEQNDSSPVDHSERRKKREGATDCTHSYIMKLYDRSVDLTMYTEDTPLYPICRAWISNQPKLRANRRLSQIEKPKPVETKPIKRELFTAADCLDGDIKDIHALPAPDGPLVSRLPPKMEIHSKEKQETVDLDYDLDKAPTKEELLRGHQKRWLDIKNRWQKHAAESEKRYRHSAKILTAIYNKAQENMEY